MARWPKDKQDDLIAFYGMPKTAALEAQLVDVVPPFRMTYDGKPIRAIKFHRKAAPALAAALNEIWEAYGRDQAKIDADRVSVYSGAYNPRFIRGSTSKWSNHAYGAAIDFDAEHNGMGAGRGTMPKIVIDAFKRQGARWGGDYKGRTDPMHFEFAGGGEIVAGAVNGASSSAASQGMTPSQVERLKREILRWEDDSTVRGTLKVSHNADGTEIAGITSRNHPRVVPELLALVNAGDFATAISKAGDYIMSYTAPAAGWARGPGVEAYLRDCFFNRGPSGAAIILQRAVQVEEDGDVGPITKDAAAALTGPELLRRLRGARESYERSDLHRNEQSSAWAGLVNRWTAMLALAQQFEQESPLAEPQQQPPQQQQPPRPPPTPNLPGFPMPTIGDGKIDMQFIMQLMSMIAGLVQTLQSIKSQPAPEPIVIQPPPPPPPPLPPAPSPVEKPSVQASVAAGIPLWIAQAAGGLPGPTSGLTGLLTTVLPIAAGLFGMTGGFGSVGSIIGGAARLFSGIGQQQK